MNTSTNLRGEGEKEEEEEENLPLDAYYTGSTNSGSTGPPQMFDSVSNTTSPVLKETIPAYEGTAFDIGKYNSLSLFSLSLFFSFFICWRGVWCTLWVVPGV